MNTLRTWPVGAYLMLAVMGGACIAATSWVYFQTRASYRAVGFNDGQLHERERILSRIRTAARLDACPQPSAATATEFLSLKAETLYFLPVDGKYVLFCH